MNATDADAILARLYAAADDYQADLLDELVEQAGVRWTCRRAGMHDYPWTNPEGEPCELCGAPPPKAKR